VKPAAVEETKVEKVKNTGKTTTKSKFHHNIVMLIDLYQSQFNLHQKILVQSQRVLYQLLTFLLKINKRN